MKFKVGFFVFLLSVVSLGACSSHEDPPGIGDRPIEVKAEGFSLSTLKEPHYHYSGVIPSKGANFRIVTIGEDAGSVWICDVEVNNVMQRDYENFDSSTLEDEFVGEWGRIYGINKGNTYHIDLNIEENPSPDPRFINIILQRCDRFDYIELTQEGSK